MTVVIPEGEVLTPISRPGPRPQQLSTIHEGDSIRTGSPPSVIQLPGGRQPHHAKSTLRIGSPSGQSAAPSIIRLPTREFARRATPLQLRIGTPRAETPTPIPAAATLIRVPSAPPLSHKDHRSSA
ncbi:hypothetical protein FRC19_004036 [Serendipita sp. 401]|nr:hypothetical protein FRC19_004036 [Serendipita sp. 401]